MLTEEFHEFLCYHQCKTVCIVVVITERHITCIFKTNSQSTFITDYLPEDLLELFGEDLDDGETVTLVSPAVYTAMRANTNSWVPASEIAANIAVRGVVGMYQGCQVIVSNKLKRDFTTDEWNYYIGRNVPYEKLK